MRHLANRDASHRHPTFRTTHGLAERIEQTTAQRRQDGRDKWPEFVGNFLLRPGSEIRCRRHLAGNRVPRCFGCPYGRLVLEENTVNEIAAGSQKRLARVHLLDAFIHPQDIRLHLVEFFFDCVVLGFRHRCCRRHEGMPARCREGHPQTSGDGFAVILDFGVSRSIDELVERKELGHVGSRKMGVEDGPAAGALPRTWEIARPMLADTFLAKQSRLPSRKYHPILVFRLAFGNASLRTSARDRPTARE
ncbi:MAG TPA: hypothetical protein VHR66_28950 [Gemmataceae bacterium]|nr:hypothetical protein [Gemmataceae bacterium]